MHPISLVLWFIFGAIWGMLSIDFENERNKRAFWAVSVLGISVVVVKAAQWTRTHSLSDIFSPMTADVLMPPLFALLFGTLSGVFLLTKLFRPR